MIRCFDFCLAALLLVVLLPLMLLIAVLIALFIGRPILFRQKRPGLHGRIFTLYKFRTMRDSRDADGNLLADEHRFTRFGNMLRRFSLDELPQLFNVLNGSVALVGPRPLLIEYLPLYSKRQAKRHQVPPGITGWAQIHGRNAISWQRKFALDVWYVERRSFALNLLILCKTVKRVIKPEGVNQSASVTMTPFQGSRAVQVKSSC